MNTSVVVILLGILTNSAKSMIHSLKYFYTGSTQIPNLPEFVAVGLFNDLQITHFDSETKRLVPKQDWMNKVKEENPQIWEEGTQMYLNFMERTKNIKHHLNLTRDEHILQIMAGCEWDHETNETSGYFKSGFDGEDFLSFDLKTETWVALNPQAVFFKDKLDNYRGEAVKIKTVINHECPERLKLLVRYEERTLKKKELPLVSLLQKTSSSPVTCHATGFYPRDRAMLNWTKDGEELHENVDPGEILPNNDGTFQMSVDLDVSSLPSEDWERYECVLKVSGDKDIVTKLDRAEIITNEKNSHIIAVVLVVLGVAIFAVVGVVLYRRFRNNNAI